MKLLIALEQHFVAAPDGHIYTPGPENYAFWRPYLEAFQDVAVLARVATTTQPVLEQQRADGPGVSFCRLPNYVGPLDYVRKAVRLHAAIRKPVANADAYILRLPGAIGNLAAREIRRQGRVYAIEVLGDPWDTLCPGAVRTPLRPVYRRLLTRQLRRRCREAVALHYVTQNALQARYPAGPGSYSCSFSDVSLGEHLADSDLIENRKKKIGELANGLEHPAKLGFVGSLELNYKGADILLKAVDLCRRRAMQVEAHLVGDGRSRPQLEALAGELQISNLVHFHGRMPAGKALFDFLDGIDIFVMPSRAEGLPRALVEAMARGCPCIGSAVGGIPELLIPEALVPPSDETQLAFAIRRFLSNPALMVRMSDQNVKIARGFGVDAFAGLRRRFLREVYARCASSCGS